jgi:hypothetical protein
MKVDQESGYEDDDGQIKKNGGDYAHGDNGTGGLRPQRQRDRRGLRPRRRRDRKGDYTHRKTTGQGGDYAHKDEETRDDSECTSLQNERQDVES